MKNTKAIQLQTRIDNLTNYVNKSGYDLRERFKSLRKQGSKDYSLQKAINYRDNYINVMQKYKGRRGFDELMQKLKSDEFIQNPKIFYDTIKDDEDISDLYRQSNETLSQAEFEELLEVWGIEIDKTQEYQEEVEENENDNKKYRYGLIRLRDGKIISMSDSVTYLINIQLQLQLENKDEKYEIRNIE